MKKQQQIKSLLLLMLGLFTLACTSETSESTEKEVENTNTTVEQTTTTTNEYQAQDFQQPEELILEPEDEMLITDKFYPIGWSEDGQFAYIIEPLDEAIGLYFIKIVIQDMNSDKILWKLEYDETSDRESGSVKETWEENYDEIKKKLNEYQIKAIAKFELDKAEFENNNEKFNILVEKGNVEESEMTGLEVYKNYVVKLKASSLGAKQIFSLKEEYPSITNAKIYGQLKSPYENRIAVLVATERIGYEGPPNTITFNIIGANLENGFKK